MGASPAHDLYTNQLALVLALVTLLAVLVTIVNCFLDAPKEESVLDAPVSLTDDDDSMIVAGDVVDTLLHAVKKEIDEQNDIFAGTSSPVTATVISEAEACADDADDMITSTGLEVVPFVFSDCKDTMEMECERHHQLHNEPSWTCTICREKEQRCIDLEYRIMSMDAHQSTVECRNTGLQRFADEFSMQFDGLLKQVADLNLANAKLKTRMLRQKDALSQNEALRAELQAVNVELDVKLDHLRQQHQHTLESCRHHRETSERLTEEVEMLRHEVLELQEQNRRKTDAVKRLHIRLESEKQARREQMDWNLSDYRQMAVAA